MQFNSMNCWQSSCCDKKEREFEFFSTFRATFHCKDVVNFHCGLHSACSRDTGFFQYFDEVNYLHFSSDLRCKRHHFQISCNRLERPKQRKKQWLRIQILNGEETGLNTSVRKGANEEGK